MTTTTVQTLADKIKEREQTFLGLLEMCEGYVATANESEEDLWPNVHTIIFNDIKPEINTTGYHVEWVQVSGGYQDEVMNYVSGLRQKAKEIRALSQNNEES